MWWCNPPLPLDIPELANLASMLTMNWHDWSFFSKPANIAHLHGKNLKLVWLAV